MLSEIKQILPKIIGYKLHRAFHIKAPRPLTLTFSITSACQSLCKSCNIGLVYRKNPRIAKDDLTIEEIEKMFKSIGHVYYFNISGGEPFLRQNIAQIVSLACEYLKPNVIHIPTNALTPKLIEKKTREILEVIKNKSHEVPLTIKPSYDGIGDQHDFIRGVNGNYEKLMETLELLIKLKKEYKNLYIGLGTVISKYNVDSIKKIVDNVYTLPLDTYISEVAENRTEMFNIKEDITPTPEKYEKAVKYFAKKVKENIKRRKGLSKKTEAFRLVYYDLAIRILKEKRQVIPCYGGVSNVHINAKGEVWPCCTLGYSKPMGDIRKENYNFTKIWHSKKAYEVRNYIQDGKCACPLANQYYSNILINFRSILKVIKNTII